MKTDIDNKNQIINENKKTQPFLEFSKINCQLNTRYQLE